jgi:hypothetical protein
MVRTLAMPVLIWLVLACSGPAWAGGNSPGIHIDPNFPPLGGQAPGGISTAPPQPQVVAPAPSSPGAVINCDNFGRCWQQVPAGTRPPGWADDAPASMRDPYRFDRPQTGVVCDSRTKVCYKGGTIDRSETKARFGDRAADRVEQVRNRNGTARLFLPDRGVTCDTLRKVCYDNGIADFSQTRRYFGDPAANALN